jgi:hypothetical protein
MNNIIASIIDSYSTQKSGHKKLHQGIVKNYFNDENKSYNKLQKNKIREEIVKRSGEIYKDIVNESTNSSDKDLNISVSDPLISEDHLNLNRTISLLGDEVFAKQILYYLCYGKLIIQGIEGDPKKNIINSNSAFKIMCDALPIDIREHLLAAIYHRNSYNFIK